MALWGNKDQANNAPKSYDARGIHIDANGETLFGNTQVSAFLTGQAVGVFGVDAVEAGITTGEGKKVAHAGWNLRRAGTGPVTSITLLTGGNDYPANGFITFSNGQGTGANASYTVNTTTKVITSVKLNSGGSGYVSAPTVTAANANGTSTATFSLTMGGRSGRVHYETLVAMGSVTGDAENTIFPNS